MSNNHFSRLVGSDSKWDSIVSQGFLFKLSTREFTILISTFTFAFAFLVARLFRVFGLLVFWIFLRERPHEPGMEQLRVAVVNFRTPFHVIGDAMSWKMIIVRRKRERRFALVWFARAIAFLFLGMGLPFTLSLFPVADGWLLSSHIFLSILRANVVKLGYSGGSNCWFGPTDSNGKRDIFRAYLRLEHQTALSETDSMDYDYGGDNAYDVKYLGAVDVVRKSPMCPEHAKSSACQHGDALSFHGQYTISPRDLGDRKSSRVELHHDGRLL
ncbi:hypothetical protein DL98DRAFT_628878 [Cadophora sp. DSE1049]|nr:hypothetical protein DL98DRAFT_628878 [Cadophora sp. DSE1049]